jgi:hypothetical protein
MAKQKGIIKLKGKIGDLSFYEQNGEYVARLKGGVDKERLQTDKAFRRTRENMAEFGGSATVGKSLRLSLKAVTKQFGDRYLTARLVKLLREITARGPGIRGKRSILVNANRESLIGFEFTKNTPLVTVFNAPYAVSANADRNEVQIAIPAFDADVFAEAPLGATHFRLVGAIGVLSDFDFNTSTRSYEPVDESVNELGAAGRSAELSIAGNTGAQTLTLSLPGSPVIGTDAVVLVCLGIEFVQEMNGTFYLLESGNAMQIVDCI